MTHTIFGQWAIAGAAFFFGIYTMAFVVDSFRSMAELAAGRPDQSIVYKTANRYPGYLLPREKPKMEPSAQASAAGLP